MSPSSRYAANPAPGNYPQLASIPQNPKTGQSAVIGPRSSISSSNSSMTRMSVSLAGTSNTSLNSVYSGASKSAQPHAKPTLSIPLSVAPARPVFRQGPQTGYLPNDAVWKDLWTMILRPSFTLRHTVFCQVEFVKDHSGAFCPRFFRLVYEKVHSGSLLSTSKSFCFEPSDFATSLVGRGFGAVRSPLLWPSFWIGLECTLQGLRDPESPAKQRIQLSLLSGDAEMFQTLEEFPFPGCSIQPTETTYPVFIQFIPINAKRPALGMTIGKVGIRGPHSKIHQYFDFHEQNGLDETRPGTTKPSKSYIKFKPKPPEPPITRDSAWYQYQACSKYHYDDAESNPFVEITLGKTQPAKVLDPIRNGLQK